MNKILVMLIFIVMGGYYYGAAILVVIALLPALFARALTPKGDNNLAICMAAMSLVATMPFLMDMYPFYRDFSQAKEAITVLNVLIIYMAAVVGWGIYFVVPNFYAVYAVMDLRMKIEAAREQQKKLKEDWGDDIAS